MIIIYNLSGLIVGAAGIIAGLFVAMLSGKLGAGLLVLAVVWLAGGLWWRNQEVAPGVKRPFPALFFIPLPFLAIPAALLGALLFLLIDLGGRAQPADRRAQLFQADERLLDSAAAAGDVPLSQKILGALQANPVGGNAGDPFRVATRRSGDAVLVLVKASKLKSYKDIQRKALLRQIADILEADEQLHEKRIFIGIKGQLTFGAIQSPPDVVQVGSVIPENKLYDFYGDPTVPATGADESR